MGAPRVSFCNSRIRTRTRSKPVRTSSFFYYHTASSAFINGHATAILSLELVQWFVSSKRTEWALQRVLYLETQRCFSCHRNRQELKSALDWRTYGKWSKMHVRVIHILFGNIELLCCSNYTPLKVSVADGSSTFQCLWLFLLNQTVREREYGTLDT